MATLSDDLYGNAQARTKARIRQHEGSRNKPYKDSLGITTIGIGRNLETVGLSDSEIEYLFNNDFDAATQAASKLPVWEGLDEVRRGVLVEMVFQMGYSGVKKFVNTLGAVGRKDWPAAYAGMLGSKWARQTPGRAKRLAEIMLTGQFDDEV